MNIKKQNQSGIVKQMTKVEINYDDIFDEEPKNTTKLNMFDIYEEKQDEKEESIIDNQNDDLEDPDIPNFGRIGYIASSVKYGNNSENRKIVRDFSYLLDKSKIKD